MWDDVKRELWDLERRLRDPALRSEALRLLRVNPV